MPFFGGNQATNGMPLFNEAKKIQNMHMKPVGWVTGLCHGKGTKTQRWMHKSTNSGLNTGKRLIILGPVHEFFV